jgi:hypothetical protein
MRKPLTYQNYQDAKEKSQRSRTEKGRTALANREQSFRDKAREKARGWQNKTPEPEVALKVGTKQVNIKGSPELYKELSLTHDPSLGWQITNKKGDVLRQPKNGKLEPTHRFKEKSQAQNFAKQVIAKVDRMTGKPATKSEPKPTPDSTGVKGAGGKSVDQQYKDIIAKSKDPKATEEAISQALSDTLDFEKKTYERYLESQKNGTVPKGYEKHYQDHIDQYKPVIEAEQFLKERRKKALDGDFETEAEVRPYLLKMMDKYKKDYDYYDSPEYAEKREKFKSIVGEAPLPPVLSGKIPAKDLRQTLKPGDKLLRKQATYGYAGSSSGNTPTGWKYSDGGEVTKVAIKNVSTKINYGMGDRMFDDSVPMRDISHVIRDGKRYKVDDSDSSPNDLGVIEKAKPKTGSARVKGAGGKSESTEPQKKVELDQRKKDIGIPSSDVEYDKWLEGKTQSLKGQERKEIKIKTHAKGEISVPGTEYEGLAVHPAKNAQLKEVYNVTHLKTGLSVGEFVDESQAKKAVAGLLETGVDWGKEDIRGDKNIGKVSSTLKNVRTSDIRQTKKKLFEQAKSEGIEVDFDNEESKKGFVDKIYQHIKKGGMSRIENDYDSFLRASPKSARELTTAYLFDKPDSDNIESLEEIKRMARNGKVNGKVLYESYWHFKDKKKNDFNSNLILANFGNSNLRRLKSKLANFAKPGCCCEASKPLKRRKTKQTPRLKRRGNRYA